MIEALENRAVEAARACARAEFAKWSAVLDLRERLVAEIEADKSAMFKRMAINATALEVGRLLHLSEQQVWRITEQASRLSDRAPMVWAAFAAGEVDVQKASIISIGIHRLTADETAAAVDQVAVAYATCHTPGELKGWLDQLIDRLQPPTLDEAESERARRSVEVVHLRNGMSYLTAHLSTPAAVAIMNRLAKAARELPDDGRTLAQKEADLFAAWLTNATGTECDITAEIAVIVEAKALAGVTEAPAHLDTTDQPPIPAAWVFELAASDNTLWTRLLTGPTGHVLDVTHLGYQPPAALRQAIRWRDMTCRVSGCHHRADQSDLDHRIPFDTGGRTTGSNLRSLCRRHHGMKGHGLLPADAYDPPAVHITRLPSTPLRIDYVAA